MQVDQQQIASGLFLMSLQQASPSSDNTESLCNVDKTSVVITDSHVFVRGLNLLPAGVQSSKSTACQQACASANGLSLHSRH